MEDFFKINFPIKTLKMHYCLLWLVMVEVVVVLAVLTVLFVYRVLPLLTLEQRATGQYIPTFPSLRTALQTLHPELKGGL